MTTIKVGDAIHPVAQCLIHRAAEGLGALGPDRDAQFEPTNAQVQAFQLAGQPAISVDTKEKELVGGFTNAGRERRPKGQPETVRVQ